MAEYAFNLQCCDATTGSNRSDMRTHRSLFGVLTEKFLAFCAGRHLYHNGLPE
jgi:hypothetical protein